MQGMRKYLAAAAIGIVVTACGSTTNTVEAAATATVDSGTPEAVALVDVPDQSAVGEREQVLCEPGPSLDAGVDETVDPERRVEALVLHLTGIDEIAARFENEGQEIIFDDPNYGGVYGDFNGGLVVAVVDCSLVDADRIAQIAGGPQEVQLIQVPYSFEEVNSFRDELLHPRVNTSIHSTTSGRWIVVTVEDFGDLPGDYGSGVPDDVFSVVEGELFSDLDGG